MADTLPPLVQEIRSDASQALSEMDKFNSSTNHMADTAEKAGERGHSGFAGMALGLGVAGLAAEAVGKTLEGLHKVIETGIDRAKDDAQINAQLAAGIQSTGGAAGTTVKGMDDLAESIARMSGQSADSIGKTESLLMTFTNIKNVGADKIFDETTLAAANMAARFGGDATQSAIQLGKALNDPVKGMTALRRVGVSFTADQEAQVKAMVAAGDTMGAQKIILSELNTEFGNSAQAAGQTLPGAIARAKESFDEMSGRIVSSFLPAITPIFSKLVDLFQAMAPHIEAFGEMLADGLGKVGPILSPIGAAVGSVFKSIEPVLASAMKGFAQLGPVFASLLPPVLQLVSAFSPVQIVLKALAPVMPEIVSAVVTLASSLAGALTSALTAILPAIQMVVQLLSSDLTAVIVAVLPIVTQLAQIVGQVLAQAMTAIAPLLKMAAQFIGELLQAVSPLIPPILQLVAAFVPLIAPIAQLVGTLLQPLVQLLTTLLQPVLSLVTGLVQMLVPALQLVVQWFVSYITPIIQQAQVVFQGLGDFISGVFSGNWSKAWQGIQEIFSGVWSGIKDIAAGAVNGIIDLINGMIGTIDDGLSAINSISGGLVNLNVPKLGHVSFDVGTERVPGADNQPLPAIIHGGEAVLSNPMLSGAAQIPQRVVDAVHKQDGPAASVVAGGTTVIQNVSVTQTNPSPEDLAAALGFHFRVNGG